MKNGSLKQPKLFNEAGLKIMSLAEMEKVLIEDALILYDGNISRVAEILKVGRNTLYRKIREYQIDISR